MRIRMIVVIVLAGSLQAAAVPAETLHGKEGKISIALPEGWEAAPDDSPMRKPFTTPDRKIFARSVDEAMDAIAFREAKIEEIAEPACFYILHDVSIGGYVAPLPTRTAGWRDLRFVHGPGASG